ncbi:MAG: glycosyltransferase 2 family protein, partial [Actinomycetota bacterium]|nr:glycosyltransferase 2 family protein [Actinomycetota bacterium]
VFNRVAGLALRLLRRPGLERGVSGRGTVTALGWAVAQWVLWGLALWVLARAVPGAHGKVLPVSVGGYALAWTAGFLVVLAPAGAGVREVALTSLLSPSIGYPGALGVALLARLLTTFADLFWGVTGVVLSRLPGSSR